MFDFLKRLFQRKPQDLRTVSGEPLSPEVEAWLYRTTDGKPVSAAVRAFIDGTGPMPQVADIDPTNTALYGSYCQACELKKKGDLNGAANLLKGSCEPPSIYQGHYRLLFQIWRQFNRDDLKAARFEPVIERVNRMIRYDDEMVAVMLEYWGERQNRTLPRTSFDDARNLKVSDAKALLTAATALSRADLVKRAKQLVKRFSK